NSSVEETGRRERAGASGPGAPPPSTLSLNAHGGLELRAFRAGVYKLRSQGGAIKTIPIKAVPEPSEIAGPWGLSFPPHWGAPPSVTLDKLISWTDHSDPGVRYFSGTAE